MYLSVLAAAPRSPPQSGMSFFSRLLGKDNVAPASSAGTEAGTVAAQAGDGVSPASGGTAAAPAPVASHVELDAVPAVIKVPKFKEHLAFDGAVRIAQAPGGKAWRIVEDGCEGQGFLAMSLMFIRDADPAPLVLLAKIFTLTDGRKPNDPSTTDWRAGFASVFSEITRVDQTVASQPTLQAPLLATEVSVEGISPDGACTLLIRERRAVQGHEEFMVTAMGPRELWAQHAVRIDAWFASVVFVPAPTMLDG